MRRVFLHLIGAGLTLSGIGLLVMYALLLFAKVGSIEGAREVSGVAGFGGALLVAGLLVQASLLRRRGHELVWSFQFPPVWASAILFVATVGLGGIFIWQEVAEGWEPFLVLVGMLLLFVGISRMATLWAPGRRVPSYVVLRATAWGMLGATSLAIVMQLSIAGAAIAGVASGLYVTDADLLDGFLDRVGQEGSLDEFTGGVVDTATIAIGIFGMYAIVAPLTEEFTKLLGVVITMRGRELAPYTVFVAGVCSGLGFAVVETLGYSLAAGEGWPWLMALRGPVALIHVTGTTLLAFGWYLQRTRGGFPLVWYYVVAVLVHGAWNGLTASILVAASGVPDGTDPPVGMVLVILGVVGLLALLVTVCLVWTLANARRWGKAYRAAIPTHAVVPSSRPPIERITVFSGTAPGEV